MYICQSRQISKNKYNVWFCVCIDLAPYAYLCGIWGNILSLFFQLFLWFTAHDWDKDNTMDGLELYKALRLIIYGCMAS